MSDRRYRIAVFGNNRTACMVTRFLDGEPDIDIVALIPEGNDLISKSKWDGVWEKSFFDFSIHFENDGVLGLRPETRVFFGNINNYAEELEALDIDLLMGCRSAALVKPKILNIPKIGVTNIHYGDLPKYGGCHTIQHAILNGEDHIGCTFHFMEEEFDAGEIIEKYLLKINDMTAFEIYLELSQIGAELACGNLNKALRGHSSPQVGERLYFKHDSIDFKKDSVIDVENMTREQIGRVAKAFYFPPFQMPTLKGK